MKVIDQIAWSWTLYEYDGEYMLSVICGSVGLFSRDIILNIEETDNYLKNGIDEIIKLAKVITYRPQYYKTRHIIAFHEDLAVKNANLMWREDDKNKA